MGPDQGSSGHPLLADERTSARCRLHAMSVSAYQADLACGGRKCRSWVEPGRQPSVEKSPLSGAATSRRRMESGLVPRERHCSDLQSRGADR